MNVPCRETLNSFFYRKDQPGHALKGKKQTHGTLDVLCLFRHREKSQTLSSMLKDVLLFMYQTMFCDQQRQEKMPPLQALC